MSHPDGTHTDGTVLTHGDSHPDHSHEQNTSGGKDSHSGKADAEGTSTNGNNKNNAAFYSSSANVLFAALCILGANISLYLLQ